MSMSFDITTPLLAGMSIFPVYRGFEMKTHLQLGQKPPPFTFSGTVLGGLKAIPSVSAAVGAQIVAQNELEGLFKSIGWRSTAYSTSLLSSFIVGAATAAPLAVFNGTTMGLSFIDSVKKISPHQVAAIAVRDTAFLFFLKMSDREPCKKINYGVVFITNALGSVAGHFADTALTLLQKGYKVTFGPHLMRGVAAKAPAVGLFAVIYKWAEEKTAASGKRITVRIGN